MESPASDIRNTSVVIVTLDTGEVYIIASLSSRTDTQLIYVDPTTGALCYNAKLGIEVFKTEEEAINYVTNESRWLCKSAVYARAILGYATLGSVALLLVATKLTASIQDLPGGGCVYTVTESQWIKIALQNPQGLGKGELKSVQELTDIDIDGKHYFCETRDITRPFPSQMPVQAPDHEFVWNQWLSVPFKNIGLPQHCVILLQGFAECRNFGISGQQEAVVAITARRSKLHPGTRYIARGLNSCSSTGNEVECEQLIWVPKSTGQSVPFNTYIWRRGTIPIWWGAELKITAAEAEIYVSDRDPYKGSSQYYERLNRRYDVRNSDVAVQGTLKKSSLVPIVCINLLRNGLGKSECILVQHFEESLNYIRSTGSLPNTRIDLVNYDWHATIRYKGDKQTIEGLWKLLKDPTMSVGFSEGDYLPSRQQIGDCRGEVIYNDDYEGAFCLRSHQIGVIRFNCADSLDRTNAASFFGALQVFVEQCRGLGISLDSDTSYGYQSTNDDSEYIASLPQGWEKRSDAVTGKTFYIDHNTRTTTWNHPCPDKPWKRFDMTFDEFKRSTVIPPVSQLADLFLTAGDIHATLYTGSKAMHSQILSIFTEEAGGAFKQFSAAQNMKITLQRRYKNAIVDSSRQKQLEMFLGVRLFKHLPSIPLQPLHVLSRPSGFLLKPVINMFPGSNTGADLLSFKRKALTWACPQAADVVQLFIYLGEPCHVCQLLLTVSHGVDDTTYPSTIDVRTGRCLDGLQLVLEETSIPRCTNGTNLLIPLPGPFSEEDMAVTGAGTRLHGQDTSTLSLLYDFEELEGEMDFLTRIVAITFYPAVLGSPMTVGEVEILGMNLPWRGMFTNEAPGARLYELAKKCQNETDPFKCRSDSNSFLSTSLSCERATKSVQPNTSVNLSCNLLTCDDRHSEHASQPMTGNTVHSRRDLIDLSDQPVPQQQDAETDNKISSSDESNSSFSSSAEYIKILKSLGGSNMERKLGFTEAMKLEIERLRLNLSAAERDRVLLSIGTDPATMNPNTLHDESYMGRLWKVANALALLGQTAIEDKIIGNIGLEAGEDNAIDFWNISRIGDTCSRGACQITTETKELTDGSSGVSSEGASESVFTCSECKRTVCKVCCAGKGALLLVNPNPKDTTSNSAVTSQGGSSLGSQVDISTNRSVSLDGVLCKECCPDIVLDALILDYVRVLVSLRRSSRADTAAYKALEQVLGSYSSDSISESIHPCDNEKASKALQQVLNGEESLAEFPEASFLQSVETATDSAPLLSMLAPLDSGSKLSYWKAPPSCASAEFGLALGTPSDVSAVILLVSPCGYSVSDAPSVQIWAGNKMDQEERLCMGKWDVRSLIAPSSEYYGEEKHGTENSVPRHIKFDFKNPVRCRIIWMTLCLQRPRSTSVTLGSDLNALCEGENPPSEENRRASLGGPVERDTCLHAKRILVVGRPVRDEIELSTAPQGPEPAKLKNWLERTPQMNRFKVPVDAERLMDNDLVLEQYLSLASPMVAGFRLDAFAVIQRHVMHSPSSRVPFWDTSSTILENRHISPAVLFIQVSVFQEPNSMVTVGEYRLPQIKAGMSLYYDFSKQIQSRRITFKLLGDVSSFTDDPEDSRGLSVAAGLSLSNRVKLYYYADPYEVGKWASLSAV